MSRKSSHVSLGDVARAAGISTVAAGYAMRDKPGVSKETRARVRRIARQLGYAPDARIATWMQRMREAKSKDLLPIAWLNSLPERDAWTKISYLSPYLEGAQARALELGYRIEPIWARQEGMTMRRISRILYQRGIEGVVVSQPARHIRLDWTHLAGISIDGSLLAPGLHRVMSDHAFNLQLALKALKRLGYHRIGICLSDQVDSFSHGTFRTTTCYFQATTPKAQQVTPLYLANGLPPAMQKKQITEWYLQHRPDTVVCLDSRIVKWLRDAGARVPEEVSVVHLAVDDDVGDWAGIYSDKREIGATAVEWVISLLQNRRFGLPKKAVNMLVRGSWQGGCTLRLHGKPLTSS